MLERTNYVQLIRKVRVFLLYTDVNGCIVQLLLFALFRLLSMSL